MNLFTKIKNSLLETRRPLVKTIVGSLAVIGVTVGVVAVNSQTRPSTDDYNDNNLVIEKEVEATGNTIVADELVTDLINKVTSTVTTVKSTTAKATTTIAPETKTATTITNIATTISETTASTKVNRNPAPVVVTPATDDGDVITTESVINNDTIETTDVVVVTTIESTTSDVETNVTTVVEGPREFVVYKPSTHYCHRNTCHWYTDECYEITSTEGLECRICTECNPDIVVVTPYVESAPTANVVNTSGHAALNYITEEERIYLCNTVAQEYGSDWVSIYDKACVVATVMNRVRDGGWTNGLPSTVYNVLTAPYQYNPNYAVPYYWSNVTQSCIDAVDYYFEHQGDFPNWHSFWGDGTYNYFR